MKNIEIKFPIIADLKMEVAKKHGISKTTSKFNSTKQETYQEVFYLF
ncbi:MAG: hypothetical protein N2Z20_01705 [Elusimicrobiales bacterium]|nr:hypothetical protein [Elusimicrobiales bacterium]